MSEEIGEQKEGPEFNGLVTARKGKIHSKNFQTTFLTQNEIEFPNIWFTKKRA